MYTHICHVKHTVCAVNDTLILSKCVIKCWSILRIAGNNLFPDFTKQSFDVNLSYDHHKAFPQNLNKRKEAL